MKAFIYQIHSLRTPVIITVSLLLLGKNICAAPTHKDAVKKERHISATHNHPDHHDGDIEGITPDIAASLDADVSPHPLQPGISGESGTISPNRGTHQLPRPVVVGEVGNIFPIDDYDYPSQPVVVGETGNIFPVYDYDDFPQPVIIGNVGSLFPVYNHKRRPIGNVGGVFPLYDLDELPRPVVVFTAGHHDDHPLPGVAEEVGSVSPINNHGGNIHPGVIDVGSVVPPDDHDTPQPAVGEAGSTFIVADDDDLPQPVVVGEVGSIFPVDDHDQFLQPGIPGETDADGGPGNISSAEDADHLPHPAIGGGIAQHFHFDGDIGAQSDTDINKPLGAQSGMGQPDTEHSVEGILKDVVDVRSICMNMAM